MARHFLIDMDTASDDAVALVMAMQHPGVQIEAIPVYPGMPGPLTRPLETAQFVHGQDGMGEIGLPLTGRQPATGHAVGMMIETLHRYPGDITLVTLGPLTNTTTTLRRDPWIANVVSECVIMGGTGQGGGNITPVGEYNFWANPEARIVLCTLRFYSEAQSLEYADHPIDKLYRAGLSVGVNIDTRTISNITLSQEYEKIHKTFGWESEDFLSCYRNALKATFVPEDIRTRLMAELDVGYQLTS